MTAIKTLSPITSIEILRAEGVTALVDNAIGSYSASDIDAALHTLASAAPVKGQGYDKVQFRVTWAGGTQYEGRIDLDQSHANTKNIVGTHIEDFCESAIVYDRPLLTECQRSELYRLQEECQLFV